MEGEPTGEYDLISTITHQGRSIHSGHYVAWNKFNNTHWVKFDDDKVSMVTNDEILSLSGGGDFHSV